MSIDSAEVLRIAKLARLHIEPEEAKALAADLDRIVHYIDALKEVELPPDAESLTYFDTDVHREDRNGECLSRDEALRNAPETDGEYFFVPRIVGKEDS
ncbi:MAG: Asp-tRNA(Asn)/Glu-tRNA(Gln) amidotransferase subunit GatC [Planctomycetota bacterium]|jgi:aspartyl-tRNA(Asn)/glutamyl-tRNA(Gln) amidotransferase subunit C